MYILALESSTTSAKAMLYNTTDGTSQERAQVYRRGGAAGTQDAEAVFRETAELGRELAAGKDVAAISLGGVWHSVMLCDHTMTPRTPIYQWAYTGAAELCKALRANRDYVRAFYHKTGCMVNAIYPFFKLKLLAGQGYDLTKYRIMGQGTYNNYRLTGEWAVTDVIASGTGLLNIHSKVFDGELLQELGIDASQLGRLVTYRDTLTLSGQGAELLGLRPGIPVTASMSDGSLNQVGSGAIETGVMTFSVGTSGALRMASPRPVIPETPGTWCYLGPDVWLSGAATSGCCNCIDWYKNRMGGESAGYAEMDKEAGLVTGDTPVFLPFLFGERCPGWNDERNAAFFGIKPEHTKSALYRAVLEGVLFNLYQCYEVMRDINDTPKKIKLSGGILNSPFWTQMCADIFGQEIEIDTVTSASLLGGVVLAQKTLGLIGSLSGLNVPQGRVIVPDTRMAKRYGRQFERYMECYNSTQYT